MTEFVQMDFLFGGSPDNFFPGVTIGDFLPEGMRLSFFEGEVAATFFAGLRVAAFRAADLGEALAVFIEAFFNEAGKRDRFAMSRIA